MAEVFGTSRQLYLGRLRYFAASLIVVLLVSACTLLLVRDLAGAVSPTLGLAQAVFVAIVLVASINVSRYVWGSSTLMVRWLIPAAILCFSTAILAHQAANSQSRFSIWLIVVGSEILVAMFFFKWPFRKSDDPQAASVAESHEASATNHLVNTLPEERIDPPRVDQLVDEPEVEESGAEEPSDAGQITQQITRSSQPGGGETITGRIRVDFVANEKQNAAHLTFTPPLRTIPEIYVEQSDGPSASVAVVSEFVHGARIDVRLDNVQPEPANVWIEIYVVSATTDTQQ